MRQIWWPETQKWLEVPSPVDIDLVRDRVHLKTKVAVVLQGQLKGGMTLGKQQLRCWNVRTAAEAIGVVFVDDEANVELEFPQGTEPSVKLRGLLDTGAGLSLMALDAWKKISTQDRYPSRNLPI